MTALQSLDLRCYVVTGHGTPQHIINTAREAARGGAGIIQIRSKPIEAGALLLLAEAVAIAVAEANPTTKVLIDDRLDVAALLIRRGLPIHGVHLGQQDIPIRQAREFLGPDAIIGLSTGNADLIRGANLLEDALDYVGAGPFRPTPTKNSGRSPIGLAGYPELLKLSKLPIVAIGDVQPEDVPALARTGVAGVAMVRSFMESADPSQLAQDVLRNFGRIHE